MLAGGCSADSTAGVGLGVTGAVTAGGSPPGVDGWLASAQQLVSQGALSVGYSSKAPALETVQSGKVGKKPGPGGLARCKAR